MYGIILIFTLVIVGGAIAYIGDRLGMKIGRKKLTLFGLRPKHTSILVTIVTGVLISAASIGLLSIASQDVRTALFNMKEIQDELQGLQRDYFLMRGQRDEAQLELQEAEESYKQTISDLEEAEESVVALRRQATLLEDEVVLLRTEADQLLELYGVVETAFGQMRMGDIAFNASEVFLTTVVNKNLGREGVRARLESFLGDVDNAAYRRSARAAESDTYRAIFLQPGVLDFVVEDVLLAPGDVIVRAVSQGNSIPGVPVVVYLETYPDQMVFSQDTVLASTMWDPASGVDIDFVILQSLLSEANGVALNAGMAVSRDRSGAILLPGDDFRNVIFASKEIAEPVEVRIVVAKDTWRSETPVDVYLEIIR